MTTQPGRLDLSIVIAALNEAENLELLLPQVWEALVPLDLQVEVLVVDENADEATRRVTRAHGAILHSPDTRNYGAAISAGICQAQGEYLLTMDADLSHPPQVLTDLWSARGSADVVIASRYVRGGQAIMPFHRLFLSRVLNFIFSRGLGLPVRDMSSGYRIYHSPVVKQLELSGKNFDVLQEILVKTWRNGCSIREIPFVYQPREHGSSHARIVKFGMDYLRAFLRLAGERRPGGVTGG